MEKLYINHKKIRAQVIKEHLGERKAFCFSCGNATRELKIAGVNVIPISPKDELNATTYIHPNRALKLFECFNATSGCLPMFLVKEMAREIRIKIPKEIREKPWKIYVPTGSGELLLTLMYVFPASVLRPFTTTYPPLNFEKFSPLYDFITTNFVVEHWGDLDIKQAFEKVKDESGYFIYTEGI